MPLALIHIYPDDVWLSDQKKTLAPTHSWIVRGPRAGIAMAPASRHPNRSYPRFPSTALRIFGDDIVSVHEAIDIARLLTDLAQINLACLESRVERYHPKRSFALLDVDDMWHTMQYYVVTASLIDDEDYSRVAYFVRKYTGPTCLGALATDGLLDEFFSAWSPLDDNGDQGAFNVDRQCNLVSLR